MEPLGNAGRRALFVPGAQDDVVPVDGARGAQVRLEAPGVGWELVVPSAGTSSRGRRWRRLGWRSRGDGMRARRLGSVVDDVLVGRDAHGLAPRVARELQRAAAAANHGRFRRLPADFARLLDRAFISARAARRGRAR